jgi:SAM-dependent methyltransferase
MTQARARELCALLARLYRQEVETSGSSPYLTVHASAEFVKHQVNVFLWYSQFLPPSGRILDWGCNHGPDTCLLREVFDERYELHGCDFVPESEFPVFRDHARPHYQRLTSPLGLPYAENTFDVVIGSGVLEHTAMDMEALKSLFQVLKPDGTLIISYLPYRWSSAEWYRRHIRKADFHRRVYGKRKTETLLKHCGFYPLELSYQTFVPNVVDGKLPTRLKRLLAPVLHPVFSHSVVGCAARKMTVM